MNDLKDNSYKMKVLVNNLQKSLSRYITKREHLSPYVLGEIEAILRPGFNALFLASAENMELFPNFLRILSKFNNIQQISGFKAFIEDALPTINRII